MMYDNWKVKDIIRVSFDNINKNLLSQEVRDKLVASITSGKFKPGDKLPSERELMEQFGVSRVTIRDALGSVKNMGS